MSRREDDPPCERCGKPVHLQHDPPQPCGKPLCDTCPPCTCRECKAQRRRWEERFTTGARAEREMFASGVYSEAADPLYVVGREPAPYAPRAGFCTTHNRYHEKGEQCA